MKFTPSFSVASSSHGALCCAVAFGGGVGVSADLRHPVSTTTKQMKMFVNIAIAIRRIWADLGQKICGCFWERGATILDARLLSAFFLGAMNRNLRIIAA